MYSIFISDRSRGSTRLKLLKRDAVNANLSDRQESVVTCLHDSVHCQILMACSEPMCCRVVHLMPKLVDTHVRCALVQQVRIFMSACCSIQAAGSSLEGSDSQISSQVEGE